MINEYFAIELSENWQLAFPLENIENVIRFQPDNICSIPGVAYFWLGVIHLQGSLLWVLDSYKLFNLSSVYYRRKEEITAVILNNRSKKNTERLAMVVKNLKGIVTAENIENYSQSSLLPNLATTTVTYNNEDLMILSSDSFFKAIK